MTRKPSFIRLAGALALIAASSACDDTAGLGEHANISRVLLTVHGQPVVIDLDGANNSFNLDGGVHDVTAIAYDPDGDRFNLDDEYSLVIGSSNQGVARFVDATNMTGTLVTAEGTATLFVAIAHNHADERPEFGPYPVTVNVE